MIEIINEPLLTFQRRQGDVHIRNVMLAWHPVLKFFAIIEHPAGVRDTWNSLCALTGTRGIQWCHWTQDTDGRKHPPARLLAMLNAEVMAILLSGEADAGLVRRALAFVPQWQARCGESASWPFRM